MIINIDLFSGYMTSYSEKADDLSNDIIQAVIPIRHCSSILVYVDEGPALTSLAQNSQSELLEIGIKFEL